ncbi:MAG: hypothetical protein GY832_46470 [Chloroflexi bacterium]|nr:hypothetical protein [Chloroflexota bacterium]
MRNARVNLRDQARVQNIKHFLERDKQRQQQPALMEAVDRLMSSIAGQPPPPDAVQLQGTQLLPPADPAEDNRMDMGALETEMNQGDVAMGDGNGAHESECMENGEVAKEA